MASQSSSLEDVLASAGVDPDLSRSLIAEGWTTESFGLAAASLATFDAVMDELFPSTTLTLLQKAQLRAAYVKCQRSYQDGPNPQSSQEIPKESSSANSWAESFAPKLDNQAILAMKSRFLKHYPSELLNQDTTPSTRLLSLVHHQLQRQEWKWVPWKYRLSVAKCEDIQANRASKIPRLEGLSLGALLMDEIPAIDVNNDNMGINAVRTSMDLFNTAVAMCEGAHLANLKEYSLKFISLLTQRAAADTGLRTATVLEAQAADRQIWGTIGELVTERGWSFDNALHEMTHVRSDLAVLLQLRPKVPKHLASPSTSNWQPQGGKGKGKSGGKQKGKSPSKGKHSMVTELRKPDGTTKQLCINWQHGRCNRADCRFIHGCAYPMPDGNACGDDVPFGVQDIEADVPPLEVREQVTIPVSSELHAPESARVSPNIDHSHHSQPSHFGHSNPQTSIDLTSIDGESITSEDLQIDGEPCEPTPPVVKHISTMFSPELHSLSQQVRSFRIFLDICAGASRPLSQAVIALHADVISFDILLDAQMDLLSDPSFEALLKLCASGAIAYGAASPSCSQYSRLKLRSDSGPPALRTPEFLQGVPGLAAADLAKVQESFTTLSRCLTCLSVIHSSGGHVHLEQPSSAMSWLEPETQSFIRSIGIHCINLAACQFGRDWHKNWMFSSSFPALTSMGCTCPHPAGSHQQIAGQTNQAGNFLSRDTACYPQQLAHRFAEIILPLLSTHSGDITWNSSAQILPVKSRSQFPHSREDGGGLHSQPDWSRSDRTIPDTFASFRKQWLALIIKHKLDKKLIAFCSAPSPTPPFTSHELQPFRILLEEFILAHGHAPDWSIREHQPMHLRIMHSLSLIMGDEDTTLFPCLLEGVSTGFLQDIPPSGCFPPNDNPLADPTPLSIHTSNWQSAEDNMDLTRELVQEEINQGWVFEYNGTIADAQQEYPCGIAIGKLGVALSDTRPPRLVVDNSVCGLNGRCAIPEHSTLPSAKDVIRSYPIRECQSDLLGFSLDIKSAHKRIVVKPSEQGLVGFSMDNRIFFYRVCPFGASFSAAWWSRLGGFLLRCFHRLIWLSHVALLYVDDFFIYQNAQVLPCSAAMLCIFCLITQVPISWKKCELGSSLKWIGWNFHIRAGYLTVPQEKIDKIIQYLQDLVIGNRTSQKRLEKTIGITMWLTQLWPYMRIWLHHLYKDLYSIPSSLFSISLSDWPSIQPALDDNLRFQSQPPHTGIPIGGTLVSVGHQAVKSLSDLYSLRLRDRIWLRIRDPGSSRRKLSDDSQRIVQMFQNWLTGLQPIRTLRPRPYWHGRAAADAMASGAVCQIGGFITNEIGQSKWFSEKFSHDDFKAINIDLKPDLQKSITCLETLAQIAILWVAAKFFPGHRLPICLKSLSDNTGAEAASNKLFTMSRPHCFFVEKLCLLSALTGMEIDVTHIPGHDNHIADDLSRWNGHNPIPHSFVQADRIRFHLADLWIHPLKPSFIPANVSLPWSLPS